MGETTSRLLDPRAIDLNAHAADQEIAIRMCGQALVDIGAVEGSYIEAMLEREASISTYLGEGVAIPHGTVTGKEAVRHDALAVLRFPDGVDWGGDPVTLCIAIAAQGDGHIGILTELAEILLDPERARGLREATVAEDVVRLLQPADQPNEKESTP
jgi:PTS system mannitol-specific IIA component